MDEENMMDDEAPQTNRSESAFSGTSDEDRRLLKGIEWVLNTRETSFCVSAPRKRFHAVKYGHSVALLVPREMIPVHRDRNDVLEVKVARAERIGEEFLLYTTHLPGFKRAYLDLARAKATHAEEFLILAVRLYNQGDFVSDFNVHRPIGFMNTALQGSSMRSMLVDGITVPLKEPGLRTYQGQAVLDFELGDAGPIKITKNVDGFKIRLGDHSLVTSLKKHGGGLLLTYSRTDRDPYPHIRAVVSPSSLDVADTGVPSWRDGLRLTVIEKPSSLHGWYQVEVSLKTLRQLSRALDAAKDLDEYRELKGEMAEEMVKVVLPALGMRLVADHPKTPRWWTSNSKRPGPDLLTFNLVKKDLCYVESKWWGQVSNAIRDATRQVLDDLRRASYHRGKRIAEGYIAVLEWELQTPVFRLHFERVE
jgi:hypothetical protein